MSLHLKQCSIKQRSALIRTAKANVSASKDFAHRKTTCWRVSSAKLKCKTKHRSRISCEWKDLKHWKWHVSVSLLIGPFSVPHMQISPGSSIAIARFPEDGLHLRCVKVWFPAGLQHTRRFLLPPLLTNEKAAMTDASLSLKMANSYRNADVSSSQRPWESAQSFKVTRARFKQPLFHLEQFRQLKQC